MVDRYIAAAHLEDEASRRRGPPAPLAFSGPPGIYIEASKAHIDASSRTTWVVCSSRRPIARLPNTWAVVRNAVAQ